MNRFLFLTLILSSMGAKAGDETAAPKKPEAETKTAAQAQQAQTAAKPNTITLDQLMKKSGDTNENFIDHKYIPLERNAASTAIRDRLLGLIIAEEFGGCTEKNLANELFLRRNVAAQKRWQKEHERDKAEELAAARRCQPT